MKLRYYKPSDCEEITTLFYDTVHTINTKDYTLIQLDAWADKDIDIHAWKQSFEQHVCIVAEMDGKIAGFGDMAYDGYLDRLYVHKDYQNCGIASVIMDALEQHIQTDEYYAYVSITAKPFLKKRVFML